ncbi:endonuclease/exonuclease/phosphatase family protein [Geminicoccus harenae]|uniref:endonuclease/exonuclease/phosphatase family protein n=2 Tax=Geminicoccus harenae TaxID=2498453 RepID=UPI001C988C0B|nr:endonuclease/exonuclease/phosphatase family protein [Geminicoccus harenae]
MSPSRFLTGLATALLLALGSSQAHAQARPVGEILVMTQNQYIGADLATLSGAGSPSELNEAVLELLRQAAASPFPPRAERQAAQIQARRPELVGLQEVFHLSCRELPPRPGACTEPTIAAAFGDHLRTTLAALEANGGGYEVAARVVNFDLREALSELPGIGLLRGLPFTIDGKLGLLSAYDQDVILRRRDIATSPVVFPGCRRSAQGCNYRTEASIPLPLPGNLGRIGFRRGFVGVDTVILGRSYRFVNTHLEVATLGDGPAGSAAVQSAQAAELLGALNTAPRAQAGPTIVVGDFNSGPADQRPAPIVSPYRRFTAAGFLDSWAAGFPQARGFTCCQAADLRNPSSILSERIDQIFVSRPALVRAVRLDGNQPAARTAPVNGVRLWPSDHAGVAAWLRF